MLLFKWGVIQPAWPTVAQAKGEVGRVGPLAHLKYLTFFF